MPTSAESCRQMALDQTITEPHSNKISFSHFSSRTSQAWMLVCHVSIFMKMLRPFRNQLSPEGWDHRGVMNKNLMFIFTNWETSIHPRRKMFPFSFGAFYPISFGGVVCRDVHLLQDHGSKQHWNGEQSCLTPNHYWIIHNLVVNSFM